MSKGIRKFVTNKPGVTLGTFAALAIIVVSCSSNAKDKPKFVTKDAPRSGVLAKIAGEEITEEQLLSDPKDKINYVDLQKKVYELKMDLIKKVMKARLIGAKAKEAGMELDDFISKKAVKGPFVSGESVSGVKVTRPVDTPAGIIKNGAIDSYSRAFSASPEKANCTSSASLSSPVRRNSRVSVVTGARVTDPTRDRTVTSGASLRVKANGS